MKRTIMHKGLDGDVVTYTKTKESEIDRDSYEYEEYGKCYFCSYQHHCKSKCEEGFYYTTDEAWD